MRAQPQSIPQQTSAMAAVELAIEGELTVGNVGGFQQEALAALEHATQLTVTLANAEYLDTAAFQLLAALRVESALRAVPFVLGQVPESIRQDAVTLGMEEVLDALPINGSSEHG